MRAGNIAEWTEQELVLEVLWYYPVRDRIAISIDIVKQLALRRKLIRDKRFQANKKAVKS